MIGYGAVVLGSWAAFLLVWIALAFNVKRDVGPSRLGRQVAWRLALIAAVFILVDTHLLAFRSGKALGASQLFFPSPFVGWLGAACAVLGIGIAIWARFYLGRDWSAYPTEKEGHALVTSGPYAFVRHPIYTGVMLAGLGSAFLGSVFAIGFALVIIALFAARIPREERIMLELFPGQYPAYQARTKKLVPFVW